MMFLSRKRNKSYVQTSSAKRRVERKTKSLKQLQVVQTTFRGVQISDFKEKTLAETLPFMNAATRRYYRRFLKGQAANLFNKLLANDTVRTHSREFFILPQFVGKTVFIHNGKDFIEFQIKNEMIGHRIGEFTLTTVPPKHSKIGIKGTKSSRKIATAKK